MTLFLLHSRFGHFGWRRNCLRREWLSKRMHPFVSHCQGLSAGKKTVKIIAPLDSFEYAADFLLIIISNSPIIIIKTAFSSTAKSSHTHTQNFIVHNWIQINPTECRRVFQENTSSINLKPLMMVPPHSRKDSLKDKLK